MSAPSHPKLILSVNAGSSSLKLQLFTVERTDEGLVTELWLKSTVSKLNSPPAKFKFANYQKQGCSIDSQEIDNVESAVQAFDFFLKHLEKGESGFEKKQLDDITHICHRVVHGGVVGEKGPLVVNDQVMKELEEVIDLAPLHNGPADQILKAARKSLPESIHIAFFDSSFHNSLPDFIKTYPIDQKVAKEKNLRKYGFHGLSYRWILKNVAEYLGKSENETSIIAMHLGSGASMCAVKNGKSYDTTMGLTPLEGLPGGTRSGTVDPSLVFHFSSRPGDTDKVPPSVELSHAENLLNSSSGFKSLVGTSDFSEILATNPPTETTDLAVNIFLDRILGFFGSYWLKLKGGRGGVDAVVFAGGIGEGSAKFREMIAAGLDGLKGDIEWIDETKNEAVDENEAVVSPVGDGSGKVKLLVCRTDEESEMVNECLEMRNLW